MVSMSGQKPEPGMAFCRGTWRWGGGGGGGGEGGGGGGGGEVPGEEEEGKRGEEELWQSLPGSANAISILCGSWRQGVRACVHVCEWVCRSESVWMAVGRTCRAMSRRWRDRRSRASSSEAALTTWRGVKEAHATRVYERGNRGGGRGGEGNMRVRAPKRVLG